jgi:hypothetical protein
MHQFVQLAAERCLLSDFDFAVVVLSKPRSARSAGRVTVPATMIANRKLNVFSYFYHAGAKRC